MDISDTLSMMQGQVVYHTRVTNIASRIWPIFMKAQTVLVAPFPPSPPPPKKKKNEKMKK